MNLATNDLARITIDTPDRRLDIAVPPGVPLADLIRLVVRAGGERLAERGAGEGWVVRRTDGTALSAAKTLTDLGVRDGDVLHLVPASTVWPELEYDDIGDAIAAGQRDGHGWDPAATKRTGFGAGVALLLLALVAIVRNSPSGTAGLIAGTAAALLLAAGIVTARLALDIRTATVVTALAIPYAFVGALLVRGRGPDATDLFVASLVMAVFAGFGALGVGHASPAFIASILAAALGAVGAGLVQVTSPSDAAAIVLGGSTLGAGLIPALAVRLGGVPRAHLRAGGPETLSSSVARSDAAITGLYLGIAASGAVAATVLAATGTGWSRALVLACGCGLALRARIFSSLRHRLAALAGAVSVTLPLVASMIWTGVAPGLVIAALALAGVLMIVLGTITRPDRVSSRAAGLLEAISLLAILPLLCGALDLYAKASTL
jgi:type VII secretion integral membrane protein EccD